MSSFREDLSKMMAGGYKLKGTQISFPVYHLDGLPIEELNLSMRASNGLKRAGIMTAGEVLEKDLRKVRNLGVKSVKEIKNAMLNYSYEHMSEKQKEAFWASVLERK